MEATRHDWTIRAARADDREAWLALRRELWPDTTEAEHDEDLAAFLEPDSAQRTFEAFVAQDGSGALIGFAEASLRAYAEGCRSAPVAYLEAWFVAASARNTGVGRALVDAVAAWGSARGCSELASDTEVENVRSRAAHVALGFEDLGAVHLFRRELRP